MTLCERIESAKSNRIGGSNCRGTALYLAGLVEMEFEHTSERAESFINNLEILEEPEEPCLVIFKRYRDCFISHMGIITGVNPLLVTHRDGYDGPFFENESMKEVLKRYPDDVEYRRITPL